MKANKSDIIWEGLDYRDRDVCLYLRNRDHILEHLVMANNFNAIYTTVQSPQSVYLSKEYPDREVYFGSNNGATYDSRNMMTKAVVEYINGQGSIVTAFPVKEEGGNIGRKIYPENDI